MLPAVELQFDYISMEKRRRRYVLLDDNPQQALQVNNTHTEIQTHTVLSPVVWEVFDSLYKKYCCLHTAKSWTQNPEISIYAPTCMVCMTYSEAKRTTRTHWLRGHLVRVCSCSQAALYSNPFTFVFMSISSSTLCIVFTTLFMTLVFSHCATSTLCQV